MKIPFVSFEVMHSEIEREVLDAMTGVYKKNEQ